MVSENKKKIVQQLTKEIEQSPVIGVASLEEIPAGTLAKIKKQFRGRVKFFMTRKRLMLLAIENTKEKKKGLEQLEKDLEGVKCLIFTKENPFSIYREVKRNKMKAPAKAGQKAPADIIIPAGPTPFTPGPIISEFGALGIKATVENGKVVIKADAKVAKTGDTITDKLASMLGRLQILPMEIGLDIRSVYEDGIIYGKNVLDVDEEQFMKNLMTSAQEGINLAVETAWETKDTITILVIKAHRQAKNLGMEACVLSPELIGDLLAKAEAQAKAISS